MEERRTQKAFTLIELMVVVVILGLLVALVSVRVTKHVATARRETTKAQIYQLKGAIQAFHLDTAEWPEMLEDLINQPTGESGERWDGPYLQDTEIVPKDGWGMDFEYTVPGERGRDFEIVSYGGDKQPGGEGADADVLSWITEESG